MQLKNILAVGLSMALVATGAPVQDSADSSVQGLERRINKDYQWAPNAPNAASDDSKDPIERRINKDYQWAPNAASDDSKDPIERRINKDYQWTPSSKKAGSE